MLITITECHHLRERFKECLKSVKLSLPVLEASKSRIKSAVSGLQLGNTS